jgi:hypothetical protein
VTGSDIDQKEKVRRQIVDNFFENKTNWTHAI